MTGAAAETPNFSSIALTSSIISIRVLAAIGFDDLLIGKGHCIYLWNYLGWI